MINKEVSQMSANFTRIIEPKRRSRLAIAGTFFAASTLLVGCSSVPDWANPVEWYEKAVSTIAGEDKSESQAQRDERAPRVTLQKGKKFPNLASVPERPKSSTQAESNRLAEQLTADRKNARYSEQKIKQRSVAALPPTPPAPASMPTPPAPASMPTPPAPAPVSPLAQSVSPSTPAPATVSRLAPSRLGPMSTPGLRTMPPSRLGPTPLSRPPQFAASPPARASVPTDSFVRSLANRPSPSSRSVSRIGNPIFGSPPEDIAAALRVETPAASVGRFDSVKFAPASRTAVVQPVAKGEPIGIVRFGIGSARLSSRERQELRQIVKTYRRRGGAIHVEGHASSRTRNMDPVQHHLVNLNISLNRAKAVARELIRQGVPQELVFVAALSDSRPLYHEVMPAGEAGNRRVEVYFVN